MTLKTMREGALGAIQGSAEGAVLCPWQHTSRRAAKRARLAKNIAAPSRAGAEAALVYDPILPRTVVGVSVLVRPSPNPAPRPAAKHLLMAAAKNAPKLVPKAQKVRRSSRLPSKRGPKAAKKCAPTVASKAVPQPMAASTDRQGL